MLAFTFPGQGSQRSGMGRPWVDHPSWEIVAEASAAADRDVSRLLLDAPMTELTLTANAQLATFVQSLVVLDALERVGLSPAVCAGHSLGEYSALVAAGAVPFAGGAALVEARGDAMARAGEDAPGTMAALLGISDDDAEAACHRSEGDVWVANYNAPGQVVIAGTSDSVALASGIARDLGARKVLALPVSGAFHTPLMAGARAALRKALAAVAYSTPEIPVAANVDARVHPDALAWPSLLSAQLCAPVRWRQTIETLVGLGATAFVEVGPGGVLTGLARRCAPEAQAISVASPDDLDGLLDVLARHPTDSWRHEAHAHQGEHLYVSERVVVSPSAGIFSPNQQLCAPATGLLEGTAGAGGKTSTVRTGDLVGHVSTSEVRTPFDGEVVRWLAVEGERVQEGQPLLWLRTPASGT